MSRVIMEIMDEAKFKPCTPYDAIASALQLTTKCTPTPGFDEGWDRNERAGFLCKKPLV